MGIEDLGKKAGEAAGQVGAFAKEHSEKIGEALKSEQAEGISDKLLDGAADLVNKVTGGKHADKVEEVRANIDKQVGNE